MTTYYLNRCRPLLGTFVELNLSGDMPEEALIQCSNNAFAQFEKIHNKLSFHNHDSELSQLNQALIKQPTRSFTMSDDLAHVLKLAQKLYQKTSGVYDVSVAATLVKDKHLPNHLLAATFAKPLTLGSFDNVSISDNNICSEKPIYFDLGGIAKGYAVDLAIATLPKHITGSINAGGDMRMIHWQDQRIDIKYARRNSALKKVKMLNSALATSASYYKKDGSQFLNTKTNRYVQISGSVSVFADCAMLADALTKVALLMPRKALQSILKEFNAKAIFINRFGFSRQIT